MEYINDIESYDSNSCETKKIEKSGGQDVGDEGHLRNIKQEVLVDPLKR